MTPNSSENRVVAAPGSRLSAGTRALAEDRGPAMRVMLVLHGLVTGGAEMMVLHLARELDAAGHAVEVVSLHAGGTSVHEMMERAGLAVVPLGKRRGPDLGVVRRLRAEMGRFRPTVVHTHLPVLQYVLPAARLHGRPLTMVHTVHNLARRETGVALLRRVNRYAFGHGVVPVAVSNEVATSVSQEYGLEAAAVPVVSNGVDLSAFQGPGDRAPGPCSRAHGPLRLLCVARLAEAKNHVLLLEVTARLLASGRDLTLTLVGDGPLRSELEDRARRLGIGSAVRFTGQQQDTASFYREADLFMLLSTYEGQPMSIIEAMASGLPVVATAVGGVAELVDDGRTGTLVAPEAGEVARAVTSICDDPGLYASMSAAAHRAAASYSARAMMEGYVELYR
ncbi:glycosyltransferase [Actinomyces howellii]|uniref:Glycogen synthase n=1 Tax=Actinomyces howellii TaxID=52771 RepID=A0A448HEF0_9ACTO|nr:glycosyltransferase [Actinomyces howellii]VEG26445.1 Glycogen synthase [Actinomyces howellii]